jgi:hypothetical protein
MHWANTFNTADVGYLLAGYYVGNDFSYGLYKTTDGGQTWTYNADMLGGYLWAASPNTTYYFSGNKVYRNSTGLGGVTSIFSAKSHAISLELSPSPCHETLQISQNQGLVTSYEITDLAGRSVQTWESSELSQRVNVAALSVGMYILRASNSKGAGSYKFVKE